MATFNAAPRPTRDHSVAITLTSGANTNTGSRAQNEDSLATFTSADTLTAIVADGMGGGIDGKLFSERAVATVRSLLGGRADAADDAQVTQAVQAAIREAHALRQSNPAYRVSGTTLLVAFVRHAAHGATATVANIGDSRAYRISASGQAEAVTRDHTYGERLIDEGMTPETAYRDPQARRLTYALGDELDLDTVPQFLATVPLEPGDRLLLCTDGVSKVVPATEIGALIAKHGAQDAAEAIVRRALALGSRDNVTAVVVHCQPVPQRRSLLVPVLLAALLIVVIGVALAFGGVFDAALAGSTAPTILPSPEATITPLAPTNTMQPTTTTGPGTPTSTPAPSLTPTSTPTHTPTSTATSTPTLRPPTPKPPIPRPAPPRPAPTTRKPSLTPSVTSTTLVLLVATVDGAKPIFPSPTEEQPTPQPPEQPQPEQPSP